MNISLEYYKIFYYIAKNKNITKAAEELNLSQPSISRMLKSLENQIGTKLFIREKRGVILTNEGKELYDQIHASIETINKAEINIKNMINSNILKICVESNILNNFIIKKLENSIITNNTSFINTNNFFELNNKLVNNVIDCAIITKENNFKFDDDLVFKKITDLHICLVSKKEINSLEDLSDNTIILQNKNSKYGQVIHNYLEENNINFKQKIIVDNYENILAFINHNFGIGFVFEEFIKEQIENKNLSKFELNNNINPISIGLIYNKNNENKIKEIINALL